MASLILVEPYEPMNIYEAIEAMKIVAPYAEEIDEAQTTFDVMRILMAGFKKDGAEENALRLIALMQHKSLDEVVEQFQGAGAREYLRELLGSLQTNNIKDLINSAAMIGLLPERAEDASRTN